MRLAYGNAAEISREVSRSRQEPDAIASLVKTAQIAARRTTE